MPISGIHLYWAPNPINQIHRKLPQGGTTMSTDDTTTDTSGLSADEIRRARLRHARRDHRVTELDNAKADAEIAIQDLLDLGDTDDQAEMTALVLEFASRARRTVRRTPDARALTLDEFMSTVSGTAPTPAALGSGTTPASTAPAITAEIEAILRALSDFVSAFGMDDPMAWLRGPGADLVEILNQSPANRTALPTLLRDVANAPFNHRDRLQADGHLLVHDTCDEAERDRDRFERILQDWLPNADALLRLTGTQLRTRKDAVQAAAEGRTPSDPQVSDLNRQLGEANDRVNARNQVLDSIAQAIAVAQVRERGRGGNDIEVLALQPRQLSSEAVAALRARRVPRI